METTSRGSRCGSHMSQIKRILYATDLTKNSAYAFYFAADLAKQYGAEITMFHCVGMTPPSKYYGLAFADLPIVAEREKDQAADENIGEIKKRLREFSRKIVSQMGSSADDPVSEVIITAGHVVEETLNTANAKECDLPVLGSHGKGWLRGTFLGSVAGSVLERTRKPIFVIALPSDRTSIDWDTV